MSEGSVGTQPAMPAVLHRLLIAMVVGLAVIFGVLAAVGVAPLLPRGDGGGADVVAYLFAAIPVVMLVLVFVVMAPRVPRRRPGQSLEVYWADTDSGPRLLIVWFLCDGAAIVGLVGFLLTSNLAPALAAAVAILTLAWFAPARFTQV